MTNLILWVLAVYLVYVLLPPSIRYLSGPGSLGKKLLLALGPRDNPPDIGIAGGRAQRALRNFEESLPFFLVFTLLLIQAGKADGLGIAGAQLFLAARIAYLLAYLTGVPGLRSLIWVVGSGGLVMMLVRLLAQ